jgi:hypothetical protein
MLRLALQFINLFTRLLCLHIACTDRYRYLKKVIGLAETQKMTTAYKQRVTGSNPVTPTKPNRNVRLFSFILYRRFRKATISLNTTD